jgi:hypothetical protein
MAYAESGGFMRDEPTKALVVKVDSAAAIAPGSSSIGKVGLDPTNGVGWRSSRTISRADTNATVVSRATGKLGGWSLFNANAAARFLKIYDKASAPTVGTDVPVVTIALAPGQSPSVEMTAGIALANGLAFALTTGVDDLDTGAVAAREILVNLLYV